jgi:formylglycine-generating enzyme
MVLASAYACGDTPAVTPGPRSDAAFHAPSTIDAQPMRDAAGPDPYATYDCQHAPVAEKCSNGWCEIPTGCFWIGSPESEWGRGVASEPLAPVSMTHAFVIQQNETTQSEWSSMGFRNPTGDTDTPYLVGCKNSDCAVGGISYLESLAYANAKSQAEGFRACYELIGCSGAPGREFKCQNFRLLDESAYDCPGYRLPMSAEWEYAARAGTRTPFYSGDITVQSDLGTCYPEAILDDIAWWCGNANSKTHPVGRKRANGWGLFDMLGNSAEFVADYGKLRPDDRKLLVDPGDPVRVSNRRAARGGPATAWAPILRVAAWSLPVDWDDRADGLTVRLVRTLNPRPAVDAGGADAASDAP